jgi:hypothetical protein
MPESTAPHADDFESDGDLFIARLSRLNTQQAVIDRVDAVIAEASRRGYGKLLIVVTATPAVAGPTLAQRSQMFRQWAHSSHGRVTLAIVCEPRYFDPQKFGITIAGISGMRANAFTDEAEAREWLAVQG